MGTNDILTGIIEYILNRATRQELELMGEALRKRMEGESSLGPGRVDVNRMARSMAEGIEQQMGIGGGNINRMSRRLVADMILREQPDISKAELERLLDLWVPGRGAGKKADLPADMILTMITQFVSYGTGGMSEEDKRSFPDGWYEKYWSAFSPVIQGLVREYIHGRVGKEEFWRGIRRELGGSK